MRYRSSRHMLRRRESLYGQVARGLMWTLAAVLALVGLVLLFSAPLAELVAGRMLAARGLGPVSIDITRLDPSGVSISKLSVLGGAAKVSEIDVSYNWREVMQGRLDAIRIDGLDAKIDWAADSAVSLGTFKIFPRPAPSETPPSPETKPEPATTAEPSPPPADTIPAPTDKGPPINSLIIANSRLVVALPSGEIVLPLAVTAAQDTNGRAMDVSVTGNGKGVELSASFSAVESAGKPAQGAATFTYKISALTLPGLAEAISGESAVKVSFDAKGARAENSQAEMIFTLPKAAQSNPLGFDSSRPIKLTLGGINSRLFDFSIDRTLRIPRAKVDAAFTVASGGSELRAIFKGWVDVPLANAAGERSDPEDFNFERIGITARQLPISGGAVDGSLMLLDLKGPVAVAEGRVAGNLKGLGMAEIADRIESNLAAGFRLDGLSMSFDVKDLWLEAENLKLGTSFAQGINRAQLDTAAKSAQQINVVFSSAGGTTLTTDLALSGSLPKIITDAAQPPTIATLALPKLTLAGYLTQAGDDLRGSIKLALAEGKLTHPFVGLADIAAELGFNGKSLSGPLSALLLESADPNRPKSLDRRGASLNSNIILSSESIDIKGNITSGSGVNIGTFSYAQKGQTPGTASLKIPPRTWEAAPSFLDAFGPLVALTSTTGTFGLEVSATPTAKDSISGAIKLNLADFGFSSGALSMKGLNTDIELDQIRPLRAKSPQRISFGQLLAGVPFDDGDFTIALPGDNTAVVSKADMKLAGGTLTGRDLILHLDHNDQAFIMDVANVDLGTLVPAFVTDGLVASGKMSGRLPLRLNNSRLFIERGRLSGRNGDIRYSPTTAPAALAQGGGTILLQALADFKYDEITANLNGDVAKDLAVGLTLKGRNPSLYGGYPIEFNLSLDGPLNRLVRDGLSGYRIADYIKQRLEQQGLNPDSPN